MKVWVAVSPGSDGDCSLAFFSREPDMDKIEAADEDGWPCWELQSFEIPDGPNTIKFSDHLIEQCE